MIANDRLAPVRERIAAATAAWSSGMTLAGIRADFERFMRQAGPRGAALAAPQRVSIGSVEAAWIGTGTRRVLYCHGGGFQIGGTGSHASLMARIAEASGARVLGVDYRLAPEHRAPAAADDVFAAYRWMVADGGAPDAIIGDSAGGALALLTAMKARETGLEMTRALILLSPWLDLSMQGDSYVRLVERDIFSKPAQLTAMARTYVGRDGDRADPAVSPVHGELRGLPPVLVHAGADDITLDDSLLLDERITATGGLVEVRVFEGMCHHFQIFEDLPESAESLRGIAAFLDAATWDKNGVVPVD